MDVRYRGLVATIKCLSVLTAIECATDCLPAPALSYQWTDAFHVKLNWQRPRTAGSSVSYRISDSAGHTKSTTEQFYDLSVSTEELDSGFWCTLYIESSNCEPSKPSKCTIAPPVKLVKNFTCSLYDRDAVNCSWIPEKHSSDLQAFHRFFVDTENKVAEDIPLDCKSLGNNKMGSCTFVTRNLTDTHWILINGTLNGLPVHNTFKRQPNKYVKIPPPEVTIVEDGDHLTVTLKHVDVGPHTESCWDYQVSYSKCNEPEQQASSRVATVTIPYDKRCQYKFKAKAVFKRICGVGGSDFSEYKTHGVNKPSYWLAAVVVIPAILAIFVVLAGCCVKRCKPIIFPAIPDPSVIFKEVMNRNKESPIEHLYVPETEDVESGKIVLVMEDGSTQ